MGKGAVVLGRRLITRGDIDKTFCFDRAISRSHTRECAWIVCNLPEELFHRAEQEADVQQIGFPMILKDEELVARAKVDDQGAVEELFRRYQHKAYKIAYYMCSGNTDQAEDITQEAFVKAFKNLNTFRETASFSTWFHRIVVNTCLDEIRRRRRWERVFPFRRSGEEGNDRSNMAEESHPDPGERSNPLAVLTGKHLTRDIKKALRALSDKQRMAVQLKVFHEMSIREIAEVMESSEGTIKSHLFRGTHILRKVLKDWA